MTRFPGAPMRLPPEAFTELEPVITDRGRTLRRFKVKLTGQEVTEVDPDECLFKVEVLERKPLPMPESGLFTTEAQRNEEYEAVFKALDAVGHDKS